MLLNLAVLENIKLDWLIYWTIIGGLAAWRLTNIAHWETISYPIRRLFGAFTAVDTETGHEVVKYRTFTVFGKEISFFAELWSCFWCLSVWVSIGVFILILVFPWILLPFAISAVAIIIERFWNT